MFNTGWLAQTTHLKTLSVCRNWGFFCVCNNVEYTLVHFCEMEGGQWKTWMDSKTKEGDRQKPKGAGSLIFTLWSSEWRLRNIERSLYCWLLRGGVKVVVVGGLSQIKVWSNCYKGSASPLRRLERGETKCELAEGWIKHFWSLETLC